MKYHFEKSTDELSKEITVKPMKEFSRFQKILLLIILFIAMPIGGCGVIILLSLMGFPPDAPSIDKIQTGFSAFTLLLYYLIMDAHKRQVREYNKRLEKVRHVQ